MFCPIPSKHFLRIHMPNLFLSWTKMQLWFLCSYSLLQMLLLPCWNLWKIFCIETILLTHQFSLSFSIPLILYHQEHLYENGSYITEAVIWFLRCCLCSLHEVMFLCDVRTSYISTVCDVTKDNEYWAWIDSGLWSRLCISLQISLVICMIESNTDHMWDTAAVWQLFPSTSHFVRERFAHWLPHFSARQPIHCLTHKTFAFCRMDGKLWCAWLIYKL